MSGSLVHRANARREAGELAEAEALCREAIAENAADADAHRLLGLVLQGLDRGAEAVASHERAVSLDPTNARGYRFLAVALAETGRLDEALVADRRALTLDPGYAAPLQHLAQSKTFTREDPDFALLEAMAGDEAAFDETQRMWLLFAAAKAYDDVEEVALAFSTLQRANALKRATLSYDVAADVAGLKRTAAVFDAALFERLAGAGTSSELPIVIVGMPRSGTTLVEQILASHPAVHGGGERQDIPQLVTAVSLLNAEGLEAPDGVAGLRPADVTALGAAYVSRLGATASGVLRVTDKQPSNFRHLGLLRLIAPRARIIHCVRNPVDTCLSCFRIPFDSVDYAFDLRELGVYYRAYADLMAHWGAVLPGSMLTVTYEQIVGDVEVQARRIVAYAGLEWDDACLRFASTSRTVRTSSFAQVRRPIYDNSVDRWRRYSSQLQPLIDALGPAAELPPA